MGRTETISALVGVLALALLAGRPLLTAGFYDAHDNLINVHRVYEMERCFADGQLPCRWAADMSFGFGLPLFNYYPPLPSYLGGGLRALGLSHTDAVKAAMWLSLIVAALGMFALARERYGSWGGVIAAALFVWAPYFALDVYVRGALGEAWGLALLPFVFWTTERILGADSGAQRWAIACALAWSALLTSHLLVVMIAAPLYAAWCALILFGGARAPGRDRVAALLVAHLAAIALAAAFLVPALVEREAVHLDGLLSLFPWTRYENNFISLRQALLPDRPWGYGAFGAADSMSVFVRPLLWLGATAAVPLALWRARSDGHGAEGREGAPIVVLFAVGGWLAVMMALPVSEPLWRSIPSLALVQFPWRFLGIASFGFALACASVAGPPGRLFRAGPWLAAGVAITAVALGWREFAPSRMHRIDDNALANPGQIARTRHGAFDYLPRSVDLEHLSKLETPGDRQPARALVAGSLVVDEMEKGSDWIRVVASVLPTSGAPADSRGTILRLNAYRFPGWHVQVDGSEVAIEAADDPLGRIHVRLAPGTHRVTAQLRDTPARRAGNGVSAAALALLPVWIWRAWRAGAEAR